MHVALRAGFVYPGDSQDAKLVPTQIPWAPPDWPWHLGEPRAVSAAQARAGMGEPCSPLVYRGSALPSHPQFQCLLQRSHHLSSEGIMGENSPEIPAQWSSQGPYICIKNKAKLLQTKCRSSCSSGLSAGLSCSKPMEHVHRYSSAQCEIPGKAAFTCLDAVPPQIYSKETQDQCIFNGGTK